MAYLCQVDGEIISKKAIPASSPVSNNYGLGGSHLNTTGGGWRANFRRS